MDHRLATESRAVERYFLGEMSLQEREAFEEHYFDCADCAEDVRSAAAFRANACELLRRPGAFEEKRRLFFFSWSLAQLAPLAASLLLAGVVVYQSAFVIPGLRANAGSEIATGAVPFTLHTAVRGASGQAAHIPAGLPAVDLDLALPLDAHATRYEASIVDASGRIVATPVIQSAPGTETVSIHLNRSLFRSGGYTIMVRGLAGPGRPAQAPVNAQYEFTLD